MATSSGELLSVTPSSHTELGLPSPRIAGGNKHYPRAVAACPFASSINTPSLSCASGVCQNPTAIGQQCLRPLTWGEFLEHAATTVLAQALC